MELGRYEQVSQALLLSKRSLYRMVSCGQFPQGVYLGHGLFDMKALEKSVRNGSLFNREQTPQSKKKMTTVLYTPSERDEHLKQISCQG